MNHVKLLLLTASFIVPPLLALSILLQKGINRPKKVMVGVLLNATLIFAFNYLYFEQLYLAYSFILSLHITTMLWLFPLFYLFQKATIGDQTSLRTESNNKLQDGDRCSFAYTMGPTHPIIRNRKTNRIYVPVNKSIIMDCGG